MTCRGQWIAPPRNERAAVGDQKLGLFEASRCGAVAVIQLDVLQSCQRAWPTLITDFQYTAMSAHDKPCIEVPHKDATSPA